MSDEPLVDAVGAYMALMNAVGTPMRMLNGQTEDTDLVDRLSAELDDALERYRARTRARQEAATKEQQRA